LKNFNDKPDDLLETPKTRETQEITADGFVLIQFSFKTTKVLCVGQGEEKEAFTYMVNVMGRHGETSLFAFSDKDNMSETEREDIVVKRPRQVSSGRTAHTTTLKYCSFYLFRKEFCVQKCPMAVQMYPKHVVDLYMMHRLR
jgi:hypothetical protein